VEHAGDLACVGNVSPSFMGLHHLTGVNYHQHAPVRHGVTWKDQKLFVEYVAGISKPSFEIIGVTLTLQERQEMSVENVNFTGRVTGKALKHKPPHKKVND
jgi:hypothetical protein